MKKTICIILAVILLSLCSCTPQEKSDFIIVASCYPVYIITQNLVKDIEGITLLNMTENHGGCLHDYSLTNEDMKKLADCDMFIINGAGMEPFLEDVASKIPGINIKDASVGSTLIENNSHYWLSVDNVIEECKTIYTAIVAVLPAYADVMAVRYNDYVNNLYELKEKPNLEGQRFVSFHEGFDYLIADTGATIVKTIETDSGVEPGAKEIAEICDIVNNENITAILVPTDYTGTAANTIQKETGIKIILLDPITSGNNELNSYINSMKQNYQNLGA
ncbi:MAG TPA: zinc ABC transporter substrate-binding protein [Clostridiales bacterium]|nr:zinc ABC transporter substrate-binding protein [Clostridiales bacterium]